MSRRAPRRGPARADGVRTASDAIAEVLSRHGLADDVRGERVIADWAELVGARIAARTRPVAIVECTLVVEVASSAWLHELSLLRAQLLAGLVDRLGTPRLFDELKLRLAGGARAAAPPRPPRRASAPRPRVPPPPATGAARERIVRDAERVDDVELRELIARVRIENDR